MHLGPFLGSVFHSFGLFVCPVVMTVELHCALIMGVQAIPLYSCAKAACSSTQIFPPSLPLPPFPVLCVINVHAHSQRPAKEGAGCSAITLHLFPLGQGLSLICRTKLMARKPSSLPVSVPFWTRLMSITYAPVFLHELKSSCL